MNDEVEDVEQNYKDDFLTNIAEKLGAAAKVSLVFGEPVERDGVTVIPVAKSRWGFGGGNDRRVGIPPSLRHPAPRHGHPATL